jgi:hypothetical protein
VVPFRKFCLKCGSFVLFTLKKIAVNEAGDREQAVSNMGGTGASGGNGKVPYCIFCSIGGSGAEDTYKNS